MSRLVREFAGIWRKIEKGIRLNRVDGIRLMRSTNIVELGWMADAVRRRKHGDRVYLTDSVNVNYTNVCVSGCRFCAFSAEAGEDGAYTLSPQEAARQVREAAGRGAWEAHVVGGLNPELGADYFDALLRSIREAAPGIWIQAFTAVELDYYAKRESASVESFILRLKDAGLGGIPGGGAEIFSNQTRKLICADKISAKRWLEVHAIAHAAGLHSNATMLYGHEETVDDRVDHLLALREQQDKSGGFLAFVPLAFQPKNNSLGGCPVTGVTSVQVLAAARLLLDNFEHIRLLWNYVDRKFYEAALRFGVDDIGGTNRDERIARRAGSKAEGFEREDLETMVRRAGRLPIGVNSDYTPVGAVHA